MTILILSQRGNRRNDKNKPFNELFSFGTNLVTVINTNRCFILPLYKSTSREKQNQAFFQSGRLITQYEFCLSFRLAKVTFPKGQKQPQTIKKSKEIFSVGGSAPTPTPTPGPSIPHSGQWAHAYTSKRRNFLISSRALRAREHFSNQRYALFLTSRKN